MTAERGTLLREGKAISLIAVAHFVSHYYILLLPPVFALVKDEYGVSYTGIGLALTAFNIASATFQTPAGFLVDRVGPRSVLVAGLLLGATATAAIALVPGYWMLVAMFALLGLANTTYHPADYTILAATVGPQRIGKAFSVHTFAGYLGSGVAPACVLFCTAYWGWRGSFLVAAALGIAAALLILAFGRVLNSAAPKPQAAKTEAANVAAQVGWRLLFSAPILRNLFFFMLIALAGGGLTNFSVVALGALHGTPASVANIALSCFLLLSAAGVLLGGFIADRTSRHERVAALCFAATAVMVVLIGSTDLSAVLLIGAMSVGGVLNGVIQPSRDMMVRAVTPPGSFGKVFGFVTTGFNLGGMVSPLLYGWLMDRGEPGLIFLFVAGFILLSLLTVITRPQPQPRADREAAGSLRSVNPLDNKAGASVSRS
jgi:FSR family fosmidomycin resistance protein-like MFS transporter